MHDSCLYCRESITLGKYFPDSSTDSWFHSRTRHFTCSAVPAWYREQGWPMAYPYKAREAKENAYLSMP